MTAVAGHLTSSDFPKEFKGWDSATALSLFEAPINTFVSEVRFSPCVRAKADLSFAVLREEG
jgi:hypothetical protein